MRHSSNDKSAAALEERLEEAIDAMIVNIRRMRRTAAMVRMSKRIILTDRDEDEEEEEEEEEENTP